MKDILVASDLSAGSDRALDRALMLADERATNLTVLHVIDINLPQPTIDSHEKSARKRLADYLSARTAHKAVTIQVVVGNPHLDILERAGQCGSDLIVLGAHRVDLLNDTFRGATAWNVLRDSRVPVLLVRNPALSPYRRIAVGFDFSGYSEAALRLAFNWHPNEIYVVHVYHVPFEALPGAGSEREDVRAEHEAALTRAVETVAAGIDTDTGVELRQVICHGDAVEGIWLECANIHPDLLAIGTHGRKGLAHAVFGSVAEHLLRNPPCDIVVTRTAEPRNPVIKSAG